ncbi:MAG: RNA-directed DNA polymerase [Bacteroidetes bacterium]|nr:RNA-directed DNA polymerase [Bacteroidota bacterium]
MNSPEELIYLARNKKWLVWKDNFLELAGKDLALHKFKKYELVALRLLSIETASNLVKLASVSLDTLQNNLNHPEYKHYQTKKKKGGSRLINAPTGELKKIQKRLNNYLQAYYLCLKPKEVHGFVLLAPLIQQRSNIVANAEVHVGKKFVLNLDLKDFFPSITAKRVKAFFMSPLFNYNEQIANALTLLCTFQGKLPIGAPTSPVISNFICLKLDADLQNFCAANELNYSRYADDLSFSSNSSISNDTILDLINLITKNDFTVNYKKLRLKSSNKRQTVTGITVNEKVNVNRVLLKKIRAMLHDLTSNGLEVATHKHFKFNGFVDQKYKERFLFRLKGYINFIGQVRGKEDFIFLKFRNELKMILIEIT